MKTFTVRESAQKGIDFHYLKNGPHAILGMPVGQSVVRGVIEQLRQEGREQEEEAHALLHWVDVVPDGETFRIVREQNTRDRRALVLVDTAPGVSGKIKLYANTMREFRNDRTGRIEREANEFPPLGVELLASNDPQEGEFPVFLISMEPGASFKIVRGGQLKGAAPELVVFWTGRCPRVRETLTGDMRQWGLSVYGRKIRHGAL